MKTIIILFMSILTTTFYAQTAEELEYFNAENSFVLSIIPSLAARLFVI
ncbi:hypothetical protein [Flavobacterium flavipallidum]|uniref:Uncharacterized protein n=1 Tax=Flavobacterium flavipallidum TaxID=3139140 RepID=A0ABU9HQM5_9FLAO